MKRNYSIAPMGECGLLLSFANRISSPINAYVHHVRQRVAEAALPGVRDLVPAYASLLVTFDPMLIEHAELADALLEVLAERAGGGETTSLSSNERHTVPVQYGGDDSADLDEVARMHGLSGEDIVRLHSGRDYRVNFLGFLPGFAYLSKLTPRIVTPRLPTPRTRVSAGSVGIAGNQTAVYPFASPGGWRVIGRTSFPVWDPNADVPARLLPGDTVRFVPGAYEPPPREHHTEPAQPRWPAFEVLTATGVTTVQDLGRPGLAHLGVSRGGVFDAPAAIRANALVGNPPGAAVLEMAWNGPELRALRNVTIALGGADLECHANGALVPTGLSWFVRQGAELRFPRALPRNRGVRGYLAVAGGIDVPVVLGSRATSTLAHFGGYAGRPLRAGDLLGVCHDAGDQASIAGNYWPGKTPTRVTDSVTLRYIAFRGRGEASAEARSACVDRAFIMTDRADRMGSRLQAEGTKPLPTRRAELVSFGVVQGSIQLPPDGNPVVLNVDHQTTGGYPLLGVVIKADWPALAQVAQGANIRFEEVSVEEARAAHAKLLGDLDRGLCSLGQRLPKGVD